MTIQHTREIRRYIESNRGRERDRKGEIERERYGMDGEMGEWKE